MPVTPFHMGPGLLIKSVLQGYFSLIIFGWALLLIVSIGSLYKFYVYTGIAGAAVYFCVRLIYLKYIR